jgi:hypothetical protein
MQLHAAADPEHSAGTQDVGDAAPWLGGRFTDAQDVIWTQLRIPALLADPNYLDIAL